MKQQEWIDRYLYAVVKRLPRQVGAELEIELRTLVEDMLAERCQGAAPAEEDVKAVLHELGSPAALAAKYRPQGSQFLIGPNYFGSYIMVLKIVLLVSGIGLSIVGAITAWLEQPTWIDAVAHWMQVVLTGMISSFAVVTVVFAIFERHQVDLSGDSWSLEELPPIPNQKEVISKSDSIVGIILSVLFAVLFLAAPQIICGVFEGHTVVPVFQVEFLHGMWPVVLGFALVGIVRDSFNLFVGRYTMRVALVNVVTNVLSFILAFWLFYSNQILNPEFVQQMVRLIGAEHHFIIQLFEHIHQVLLGTLGLGLLIDTITVTVKSIRYAV